MPPRGYDVQKKGRESDIFWSDKTETVVVGRGAGGDGCVFGRILIPTERRFSQIFDLNSNRHYPG